MAGHKSIAFYKMDQLFSNHNFITALFRRLFSNDNTLKALFKQLLDKDIDDKIIDNTEQLIENLEKEIPLIYNKIDSESNLLLASKYEAKAELIGSAIQLFR